ncbi:MAG TPA: glycosyltransferase [Polyangiaceae bacterium]|nr:glycosyltransferase [Polyangiaceae bacterium]
MKVLHVINRMSAGGAERLVMDLLRCHSAKGISTDLMTLEEAESDFPSEELPSAVRTYSSPVGRMRSPLQVRAIARASSSYDLVHAHLFPSQYWAALAQAISGTPTITTEHNTFNERRRYRVLRPIERRIYSRFQRIVSVSHATEQSLRKWIELPKGRFEVIENGVDLRRFRSASRLERRALHSNLADEDFLLIMVARFTRQKDQMTVLRSLAKLPSRFKLALVGDGELLPEHRDAAHQMGVSERVLFLGRRTDVPRLLKTCDLAVLSSHWEGFGLAVVEAMAAGIPVLSSDVPGLADVVRGAGWLFGPGDTDGLASGILEIAGLPAEVREKHLELQRLRADRFDVDTTANRYAALYLDIAASKAERGGS